MSPQVAAKNAAVIDRMAARREVRRLRQNKKKVPAELLAQAGFSNGAPRVSARKRIERIITETKSGADAVRVMGQGTFKARQQAAKELKIMNRRWMSTAELDEAINLSTELQNPGVDDSAGTVLTKRQRLDALQQLGRDRCRAAWDAWKAKKEQVK